MCVRGEDRQAVRGHRGELKSSFDTEFSEIGRQGVRPILCHEAVTVFKREFFKGKIHFRLRVS